MEIFLKLNPMQIVQLVFLYFGINEAQQYQIVSTLKDLLDNIVVLAFLIH